jgi:type II secretory pathway component PulF
VTNSYENQVANVIDVVTPLLKPITMTVLFTLVRASIISIYSPIFKLNSAI